MDLLQVSGDGNGPKPRVSEIQIHHEIPIFPFQSNGVGSSLDGFFQHSNEFPKGFVAHIHSSFLQFGSPRRILLVAFSASRA